VDNLGLRDVKMRSPSRSDIIEMAFQLNDDEGLPVDSWQYEILKYFSTDELREFFDDYARLRSFSINWDRMELVGYEE
jgi:hypothetical protein|tara:strand:- start:180 stop:413 length:234 start_codon:yes stop_codon:yes gene_type:complete